MRRCAFAVTGTLLVGGALLWRHRAGRWGSTADERAATLPGDALLPDADLVATRAVGVAAAPTDVWPWVAQLGQGRGGFYSYDLLENLFGLDVHSADRIEPRWQSPAVGDDVHLAEQAVLCVEVVDPPHAFVLRGAVAPGAAQAPYGFVWAFEGAGRDQPVRYVRTLDTMWTGLHTRSMLTARLAPEALLPAGSVDVSSTTPCSCRMCCR